MVCGKVIGRGAEAVLKECRFAGILAIEKKRVRKAYRPWQLDEKIRASRTKVEARLLHKAKKAGVPTPYVLQVLPYSIIITKERGEMLYKKLAKGMEIPGHIWRKAGKYLARLHHANIVHGDYTPANLMDRGGRLVLIDFGLGMVTHDVEDYAVDVLTMKKALPKDARKTFLSAYEKEELKLSRKKRSPVLRQLAVVEKRARYQDRGA